MRRSTHHLYRGQQVALEADGHPLVHGGASLEPHQHGPPLRHVESLVGVIAGHVLRLDHEMSSRPLF